MTRTGYLKRHRFPVEIIRFAVLLNIFIPARKVSILLFVLFRTKVSHKSICEWTNKFNHYKDDKTFDYSDVKHLIFHVDEKFVKVAGKRAYWWSVKDSLGNLINSLVTMSRDLLSAKRLFKETRAKISRDVDLLARDGCFSYEKATKFLGRKCKTLITGINGKGIIYKKDFYWLTNNPAESLNSEIDTYLTRFQRNFRNLESANKFAQNFTLQKRLKKNFIEKKFSETSSILTRAILI
jgi:transposase-like protein